MAIFLNEIIGQVLRYGVRTYPSPPILYLPNIWILKLLVGFIQFISVYILAKLRLYFGYCIIW